MNPYNEIGAVREFVPMPVGVYISVPFCRSKCSFCNFASGVFPRDKMNGYVERVKMEIAHAERLAHSLGAAFEKEVDSIYLGGGTPTTLAPEHLGQLFDALHHGFEIRPDAEITVECAPGTLGPEILDALLQVRTNRVSLGTQSFVDEEIRSVGRLHNAHQTLADIAALRQSGIDNINVDLIAGLPHQTRESWRLSLERLVDSGVPHASVYILEIDEDSRLGRELIAGGERYHAHHVPDSDLAADLYLDAADFLTSAGLQQYEISNFSRLGSESRHNLKYWTRQPYFGFGVDAHSMLFSETQLDDSVRFSNADELEKYLAPQSSTLTLNAISRTQADQESFFLGLRLNRGIDMSTIRPQAAKTFETDLDDLLLLGLLQREGNFLRLTSRGRLLSNEVFERFIGEKVA